MGRITKLTVIHGEQSRAAKPARGVKITCQCGKTVSIIKMYRCHHCGIYYCRTCGVEHFGEDKTGLVGNSLTNIKG